MLTHGAAYLNAVPDPIKADHWVVQEFVDRPPCGATGTTCALLADDVLYEMPQTRERIHRKATVLRFNQEYPGEWHLCARRPVADGWHVPHRHPASVAGIMGPVRHPVRRQMDELRQMLNEWDFIGVGDLSAHDDEYDCLIGPLLTRLAAGGTAGDLTAYLQHELHDHFGMDLAGGEVHTFAARTVQWWQQTAISTDSS